MIIKSIVPILFGLFIMALPHETLAAAQASSSSWLKQDLPTLRTKQSEVPFDRVPIFSNRSCLPQTKFVIVPESKLVSRKEASYQTCAVATGFGQMDTSLGNIMLTDHKIAGPIKDTSGAKMILVSLPGSKHALSIGGPKAQIIKNLADNITTTVQFDGSIYHQLKPGTSLMPVKDNLGTALAFADTRASDNGRWLVGDITGKGMTRLNIETGETLTFGDIYNYGNGVMPHFVMAISGNGRYVLASDPSYEVLTIYDLATCVPNTDPSKKAACQSRDLLGFVRSQIPGFGGIHHAQFSTDHTIRFYAKYSLAGTASKYGYYTMTAAGEKESLLDYLALGDSFASGEGAHNYWQYTDVEEPLNKCHLSLSSYPYIISGRLNINASQSVACSGAKLRDISDTPLSRFSTSAESQAKGKEASSFDGSIYAEGLVGYRPQINFVQRTKPSNITISIGGNDMGFADIIKACIAPGTCYTDPQQRLNLVATINSKFDELVSTYRQIKDAAATDATVYMLGYPSLVATGGNCALNVRLDRQELQFANELTTYINQVVERASAKAGVTYINIEQALAGHRLCEADDDTIAVNGLTAGDDKTLSLALGKSGYVANFYLLGHESYHPNKRGHELYADTILGATHNLAYTNTQPNLAITEPTNADAGNLVRGVTSQMTPKTIIHGANISSAIIVRGTTAALRANNLLPMSTVAARLFSPSTQAIIGTIQTDTSGTVAGSLPVPTTMTPGIYTLELSGTTTSGETVLLQKIVYIAAAQNDIDGDGIKNIDEPCLFVDASNSDSNNNDLDDACDSPGMTLAIPVTPLPHSEQKANILTKLLPHWMVETQPSTVFSATFMKPASFGTPPLATFEQILGLATTPLLEQVHRSVTLPHINRRGPVHTLWILILIPAFIICLLCRKWRSRS